MEDRISCYYISNDGPDWNVLEWSRAKLENRYVDFHTQLLLKNENEYFVFNNIMSDSFVKITKDLVLHIYRKNDFVVFEKTVVNKIVYEIHEVVNVKYEEDGSLLIKLEHKCDKE
jgi:uncharacterized ubiquitin-like protein YukD